MRRKTPRANTGTTLHSLTRTARAIALAPIHVYRYAVSPLLGPRCRYYPTCSTYAVDAVKSYGVVRGAILAAWRLLRCNPFSDGGFDEVADQRLFKIRSAVADHTPDEPCACDEQHKVMAA